MCNHTAIKALMELSKGLGDVGPSVVGGGGERGDEEFSIGGGGGGEGLGSGLNASEVSEMFANCSMDEPPQYYSHTYRVVGTIFQGIIFLVGVLGNSMVVYVVARTKSMHTPTNCYLVSLALADCIVLVAAVPQEILAYYLVGNQWIWGELGCAAFIFSQNLGINASSLSLTAFTVERYIAICRPMKAQSICTVSRATRIIGGVWVFAAVYCFPWLFLTKTVPLNYAGFKDKVECSFLLSRKAYLGYFCVDLFVFYVVPLLLSMVLYSLIARILFHSHRAKAPGKHGNGPPGPLTADSTKTNAARAQVIKMLVMVVAIFAVLWLPFRGMLVYNSFVTLFQGEPYMDLWFLMFAKTCVYINSAINPILYNAMSVKFRRYFFHTLTCGKSREYSRWPYCRTNTTYTTTASTALLPSNNTTMTYNMTNFVVRASPNNNANSAQKTTTMTIKDTPTTIIIGSHSQSQSTNSSNSNNHNNRGQSGSQRQVPTNSPPSSPSSQTTPLPPIHHHPSGPGSGSGTGGHRSTSSSLLSQFRSTQAVGGVVTRVDIVVDNNSSSSSIENDVTQL